MLPIDWFAIFSVTLFGLLFGSFANVVIWRFPRGESLSVPPSHCPACNNSISWYDNVPVLSWLMLRGRCRSCGVGISVRYPAVETLSALLWLGAWLLWGSSARFGFGVVFFYLLMILAFIDLDTMRLPNGLIGLLAGVGAAGVVLSHVLESGVVPLVDGSGALKGALPFAAAGILAGGALPLAMSAAYAAIRGVQGLGMGDVKLLAVMGLFLGPYVVLALFFGSLIGAVASVAVGTGSGVHRKIPFGPFLSLGAVIAAAVGPQVWGWYLSLL